MVPRYSSAHRRRWSNTCSSSSAINYKPKYNFKLLVITSYRTFQVKMPSTFIGQNGDISDLRLADQFPDYSTIPLMNKPIIATIPLLPPKYP